eukprot:gene3838-2718_t
MCVAGTIYFLKKQNVGKNELKEISDKQCQTNPNPLFLKLRNDRRGSHAAAATAVMYFSFHGLMTIYMVVVFASALSIIGCCTVKYIDHVRISVELLLLLCFSYRAGQVARSSTGVGRRRREGKWFVSLLNFGSLLFFVETGSGSSTSFLVYTTEKGVCVCVRLRRAPTHPHPFGTFSKGASQQNEDLSSATLHSPTHMGASCSGRCGGDDAFAAKDGLRDALPPLPSAYIGAAVEQVILYERRALGLAVDTLISPACTPQTPALGGRPTPSGAASLSSTATSGPSPYAPTVAPVLLQDLFFFWEYNALFRRRLLGPVAPQPPIVPHREGVMVLFQIGVSQKLQMFHLKEYRHALARNAKHVRRQSSIAGPNATKKQRAKRQKSEETKKSPLQREGEMRVFSSVIQQLMEEDLKRRQKGGLSVGLELFPLLLIVYLQRMPDPLIPLDFLLRLETTMEKERARAALAGETPIPFGAMLARVALNYVAHIDDEEDGDEGDASHQGTTHNNSHLGDENVDEEANLQRTPGERQIPRSPRTGGGALGGKALVRPPVGSPEFAFLLRLYTYCFLSDELHKNAHFKDGPSANSGGANNGGAVTTGSVLAAVDGAGAGSAPQQQDSAIAAPKKPPPLQREKVRVIIRTAITQMRHPAAQPQSQHQLQQQQQPSAAPVEKDEMPNRILDWLLEDITRDGEGRGQLTAHLSLEMQRRMTLAYSDAFSFSAPGGLSPPPVVHFPVPLLDAESAQYTYLDGTTSISATPQRQLDGGASISEGKKRKSSENNKGSRSKHRHKHKKSKRSTLGGSTFTSITTTATTTEDNDNNDEEEEEPQTPQSRMAQEVMNAAATAVGREGPGLPLSPGSLSPATSVQRRHRAQEKAELSPGEAHRKRNRKNSRGQLSEGETSHGDRHRHRHKKTRTRTSATESSSMLLGEGAITDEEVSVAATPCAVPRDTTGGESQPALEEGGTSLVDTREQGPSAEKGGGAPEKEGEGQHAAAQEMVAVFTASGEKTDETTTTSLSRHRAQQPPAQIATASGHPHHAEDESSFTTTLTISSMTPSPSAKAAAVAAAQQMKGATSDGLLKGIRQLEDSSLETTTTTATTVSKQYHHGHDQQPCATGMRDSGGVDEDPSSTCETPAALRLPVPTAVPFPSVSASEDAATPQQQQPQGGGGGGAVLVLAQQQLQQQIAASSYSSSPTPAATPPPRILLAAPTDQPTPPVVAGAALIVTTPPALLPDTPAGLTVAVISPVVPVVAAPALSASASPPLDLSPLGSSSSSSVSGTLEEIAVEIQDEEAEEEQVAVVALPATSSAAAPAASSNNNRQPKQEKMGGAAEVKEEEEEEVLQAKPGNKIEPEPEPPRPLEATPQAHNNESVSSSSSSRQRITRGAAPTGAMRPLHFSSSSDEEESESESESAATGPISPRATTPREMGPPQPNKAKSRPMTGSLGRSSAGAEPGPLLRGSLSPAAAASTSSAGSSSRREAALTGVEVVLPREGGGGGGGSSALTGATVSSRSPSGTASVSSLPPTGGGAPCTATGSSVNNQQKGRPERQAAAAAAEKKKEKEKGEKKGKKGFLLTSTFKRVASAVSRRSHSRGSTSSSTNPAKEVEIADSTSAVTDASTQDNDDDDDDDDDVDLAAASRKSSSEPKDAAVGPISSTAAPPLNTTTNLLHSHLSSASASASATSESVAPAVTSAAEIALTSTEVVDPKKKGKGVRPVQAVLHAVTQGHRRNTTASASGSGSGAAASRSPRSPEDGAVPSPQTTTVVVAAAHPTATATALLQDSTSSSGPPVPTTPPAGLVIEAGTSPLPLRPGSNSTLAHTPVQSQRSSGGGGGGPPHNSSSGVPALLRTPGGTNTTTFLSSYSPSPDKRFATAATNTPHSAYLLFVGGPALVEAAVGIGGQRPNTVSRSTATEPSSPSSHPTRSGSLTSPELLEDVGSASAAAAAGVVGGAGRLLSVSSIPPTQANTSRSHSTMQQWMGVTYPLSLAPSASHLLGHHGGGGGPAADRPQPVAVQPSPLLSLSLSRGGEVVEMLEVDDPSMLRPGMRLEQLTAVAAAGGFGAVRRFTPTESRASTPTHTGPGPATAALPSPSPKEPFLDGAAAATSIIAVVRDDALHKKNKKNKRQQQQQQVSAVTYGTTTKKKKAAPRMRDGSTQTSDDSSRSSSSSSDAADESETSEDSSSSEASAQDSSSSSSSSSSSRYEEDIHHRMDPARASLHTYDNATAKKACRCYGIDVDEREEPQKRMKMKKKNNNKEDKKKPHKKRRSRSGRHGRRDGAEAALFPPRHHVDPYEVGNESNRMPPPGYYPTLPRSAMVSPARLYAAERMDRDLIPAPPSPSPTPSTPSAGFQRHPSFSSPPMQALLAAKELFMGVDHLPSASRARSMESDAGYTSAQQRLIHPSSATPTQAPPTSAASMRVAAEFASLQPQQQPSASASSPVALELGRAVSNRLYSASGTRPHVLPSNPAGSQEKLVQDTAPPLLAAMPSDRSSPLPPPPLRSPSPGVEDPDPVQQVRQRLQQMALPTSTLLPSGSPPPPSGILKPGAEDGSPTDVAPQAPGARRSVVRHSSPTSPHVQQLELGRLEQRVREVEQELTRTLQEKEVYSASMQQLVSHLDTRCAMLEAEHHEQQQQQSLLSMHVKDLELQLDHCKDEEARWQVELTTAQRQVLRLRDAIERDHRTNRAASSLPWARERERETDRFNHNKKESQSVIGGIYMSFSTRWEDPVSDQPLGWLADALVILIRCFSSYFIIINFPLIF